MFSRAAPRPSSPAFPASAFTFPDSLPPFLLLTLLFVAFSIYRFSLAVSGHFVKHCPTFHSSVVFASNINYNSRQLEVISMKTRRTRINFLLILLTVLTLCGCTRSALPVESYQAAGTESAGQNGDTSGQADKNPSSDEDGSAQNSESGASSSDPRTVQADFDAFTNRLFCEALSTDPLSLHFTLRNPDAFGITVSKMHFPDISAKRLREDTKKMKSFRKSWPPSIRLSSPRNSFSPTVCCRISLIQRPYQRAWSSTISP